MFYIVNLFIELLNNTPHANGIQDSLIGNTVEMAGGDINSGINLIPLTYLKHVLVFVVSLPS